MLTNNEPCTLDADNADLPEDFCLEDVNKYLIILTFTMIGSNNQGIYDRNPNRKCYNKNESSHNTEDSLIIIAMMI